MKRAVMETGFRRARDARLALGLLLALSMTANLALTVGFAGRETVTVLVPAASGPAWEVGGGAAGIGPAGARYQNAAHGDLSSEKVYVRFRTMTCAGPEPGTVVETDVAGFVAGSGKTGVRGPVVSREGALVEKAFLAGLVSGVGQGAAQAFQPQAVVP